MGILSIFRRRPDPVETRASGTGYTAQIIAARESWISGQGGLAEVTAMVQACVSLWEGAFASADVEGAPLLTRPTMALMVRALPEMPGVDMAEMAREFRGRRGRVLVRESVAVTAAGGPDPASDWRPQSVSPNLEGMDPVRTLEAARGAVLMAFGVLPDLFDRTAQGPLVREAQRHLAQWTLELIAKLIAAEAGEKFGGAVTVDRKRLPTALVV